MQVLFYTTLGRCTWEFSYFQLGIIPFAEWPEYFVQKKYFVMHLHKGN